MMAMRTRNKRHLLLKLAALVFLVYVVYSLVQQQINMHEFRLQLDYYKQQCEEQRLDNKELERLVILGNSNDYIERIAKDRYGYAYPDERIFVDTSGK